MKLPDLHRFKMLRRHLDLTQEEFAKKLGLNEQVYRNIESGRTKKIPISLFTRAVEVFGCDWDWLIKGEGEMMRDIEMENEGASSDTPSVPWEDHLTVVKERDEFRLKYYEAKQKLNRLGKDEVSEVEKAGLAHVVRELYNAGLFGDRVA